MGDYSRDTYQLTNVMHQLLTGNSVTNPRHYVGVRLEQGVPIIDADKNEQEDILRFDERLKLRHFFGEGIPSDDDGYNIGPVTVDNDFTIATGMAIVDGMLVINPHSDLTYLGQVSNLGATVQPLVTPPAVDRNDLVYLDVWEEEVGASNGSAPDARLVNPAIGIETSNRLERRWQVRVAEGIEDLDAIPTETGHSYMALALLHRLAGQAQIVAAQIEDLRRTDINVTKHLKIPLFVSRGGDTVDSDSFADLLQALHDILNERHSGELLFIDMTAFSNATMVLLFSLQDLIQLSATAALQARTRNLTNENGLTAFSSIVTAQQVFLDTLTTNGIAGVPRDTFVSEYQSRLDDVNTALGNDDLLGGYLAQQTLNAWLAADTDTLPEGNVSIQFATVDPSEPLVAGTTYDVFVEVVSNVSSDAGSEVIDVEASLTSNLWQITPQTQEVTLANNGGTQVVVFQVTPNAANLTADLSVLASVRNNPTIVSSQLPLQLEIGVEPLTGGVLNYAGPPLNPSNRVELSAAALTNGFGTTVGFELHNNTASNHSYTVEWFIELTLGDDTGWTPLQASPQSNVVVVNASDVGALACSIVGPLGGSVAGNQGTLHVTLTEVDGAPLALPDQETIDIDFECV